MTLQAPHPPKRGEKPVKVLLTVMFNKIVSINEVDETYTLDGYLEAKWHDPNHTVKDRHMFVGPQAEEALTKIWWPYFELINTVGSREVQNRRFTLDPYDPEAAQGNATYFERFRASLRSNMDFHRYPFDSQYFTVVIESFGYTKDDLEFTYSEEQLCKSKLEPHPEWDHLGIMKPEVEEQSDSYMRIILGIKAERKPEYFYFQFFLPLLLIVASAWIVFWLRDFSEQITIAFTLMLTLVAFTFFTSTLLPRLPYNTFIELSVLSGYLSIFATILLIVIQHGLNKTDTRFLRICRWPFIGAYVLLALITTSQVLDRPHETSGDLICEPARTS